MELNKIIQGDALETLKTFPNESVDCVVTSPPYWGLRDYGVNGQFESYSENSKIQEYNGKAIKNYEEASVQNASDVKRRIIESMKRNLGRNKRCVWSINTKPFKESHFATFPPELIVARKLGRNFIGIELNPEYVEMAQRRLERELGIFNI